MKNLKKQQILALLEKAERLEKDTPLTKWHLQVARNSYSSDPKRPAPTSKDIAADRAREKATRLWQQLGNWKPGFVPVLNKQTLKRLQCGCNGE